jgi:DNA-binding NarL/FixJ family response regulator
MAEEEKIRLFIVDDSQLDLETMAQVLDSEDDIEVVGKTYDARKAVDEICNSSPHPNVVLLDVEFNLPDIDGVTILKRIKECDGNIGVIMMTIYETPEVPFLAFHHKAEGFLYRGRCPSGRLATAVRSVHNKFRVWEPEAHEKAADWRIVVKPMTRRILIELIRNPGSSIEIAERLSIEKRTVDRLIQEVGEQLDLHSRPEIVAWARSNLRLMP